MKHTRMIYQTDETRERILSHAIRLFVERGLFATQMQDIAVEVGISRTSLYRYFRDKFDLATAIVHAMFSTMQSSWRANESTLLTGLDGLGCVDSFLRNYWLSPGFATELYYLAEYDAFFSGVRVAQEMGDRLKDSLSTVSPTPLATYISMGIQDGSIRADLDVHLTAVTLVNSVRGLHQRVALRGRVLVEVDDSELPHMTDELVKYLINGIRAR